MLEHLRCAVLFMASEIESGRESPAAPVARAEQIRDTGRGQENTTHRGIHK